MLKLTMTWLKKHQDFFWIILLISFAAAHLVYALKTNLFFSTDDFTVLSFVKDHNLTDIFFRFILQGDIFGFRKVLGYLVFKILFDFFKVNPLPYTLTNHFFHTLNLILLFLLIRKLHKNSFLAFFCALLFNKTYLFYFSNIHEYLVCFFSLVSILLVQTFPRKIYLALISFSLALLTKEVSFAIPFFLLALASLNKIKQKLLPGFFLLLFLYGLYQFSFFIKGQTLPTNFSYQITSSVKTILTNFFFYLPPLVIASLASLVLLQKKFKTIFLFLTSLLPLIPIFFFPNRHENYYFYFPSALILLSLSFLLPKLTIKTSLFYILIFFIFGGRSVLPVIPKQNYPNWQKQSIENVLTTVKTAIINNPKTKTIDLKNLKLERDAALMLESGTLDLFLPNDLSSKYSFTYLANEKILKVI